MTFCPHFDKLLFLSLDFSIWFYAVYHLCFWKCETPFLCEENFHGRCETLGSAYLCCRSCWDSRTWARNWLHVVVGVGVERGGWVLLTWCIRPLSQCHPLWVLAQCASRSWKSPSSGLPSSSRTKGKACLDAPAVSTQSSTSRKSRSALSSLACKPPWRTFACVHDGKLQTWLFRSRRNIIFASPTKSVSDLSNVWFFNPLTATGDFLKSLTRPFSDESRSDFVWSYDAGLCKLFVHTQKV